ncbi:MAG: hypothetical protein IKD04_05250 [Clostridia bacterium]|nr:hypothetical protein [Clostridia bacterium]
MQQTLSKKETGLIIVPYAEIKNYNSGVNIGDNSKRVEMYMKNISVACISARKNNGTKTDIALVTNIEIKEPYKSLLLKNGVKIINVPFDKFNFGAEYRWSLAFYKLCALYHVCRETNYDFYAYLDSDVFVQGDFSDIWNECKNNVLLYDINHGFQVEDYRHFLSEVNDFLKEEKNITHFGGEFFASNKENAVFFSQKFLDVYDGMTATNFVTTHGDEFILSVAANGLMDRIKNAGAYVYRYWTGEFRLVSTNYKYNPVVVLHVPSEKNTGMLKLFDCYIRKNKKPDRDRVWHILNLKNRSFICGTKILIKKIIRK